MTDFTTCCPANPAAGWVRNRILATRNPVPPLPYGWTVKGHHVAVCTVCVNAGDVAAPPDEIRTDGYCDRHLAEAHAQIRANKVSRAIAGACRESGMEGRER